MPEAVVTMHLDHVNVIVAKATEEALAKLASQIEGQTKANIADNDQIDTGFMMNSVYAISRRDSSYTAADPSGEYRNKVGESVKRKLAPEERLPNDAAAGVIVGAVYAIYQETRDSFLFKAAEKVAGQAGGICEPVYRAEVHD